MDPREAGKLGEWPSKAAAQLLRPVGGAFQARLCHRKLELEPRRTNLLGAFDDAADGSDDEADEQNEPAAAADGEKGAICSAIKRVRNSSAAK
jgi:hypothetical protein